jgi:hypothetical protein
LIQRPFSILGICNSPSLNDLKLSFHRHRRNAYDMVHLGYPRVIDCSLSTILAWRICWDLTLPCHCNSYLCSACCLDYHCYPCILRLPGCVNHSSQIFKTCAIGSCSDGIDHLLVNMFFCCNRCLRHSWIYWLYPLILTLSSSSNGPSPWWILDGVVRWWKHWLPTHRRHLILRFWWCSSTGYRSEVTHHFSGYKLLFIRLILAACK